MIHEQNLLSKYSRKIIIIISFLTLAFIPAYFKLWMQLLKKNYSRKNQKSK